MGNSLLYAASVLIWGSTWYAIRYQLGVVPPSVSVMWRFIAAGLLLLGYALLRRLPLRFTLKDHGWMALQGLFLFCLNYVGVYLAEQYLASGLVAIVFSLLAAGNIIGMRLFFHVRIRIVSLLGVAFGLMGLALLFWPDLRGLSLSNRRSIGLSLIGAATILASVGNMIATRNQRRGLPIVQVNAWSMLYGGGLLAAYVLGSGQRIVFGLSVPYLLSWAYLTVFGSVLAFGAYLTLMSRIGADRAGYAMIAIPLLALAISTWRENLRWTAPMWTGLILCLIGNALILSYRSEKKQS